MEQKFALSETGIHPLDIQIGSDDGGKLIKHTVEQRLHYLLVVIAVGIVYLVAYERIVFVDEKARLAGEMDDGVSRHVCHDVPHIAVDNETLAHRLV